MPKPKVVWAEQSPTLLNILARSDKWDLQVADLGDTGFAECQLLQAPWWDGLTLDVELVFAASPDHIARARETFPLAKIVQVAHQGYYHRLPDPDDAERVLCFNAANAQQLSERLRLSSIRTIIPHFEADCVWGWKENLTWTALSRPHTRHPMASAGVLEVLHYAGKAVKHTWHGEGQDGGFLDRANLQAKHRHCSCYLSVLPPKSGMGMTEHECMAAGVPIVGATWGCSPLGNDGGLFDFWDFQGMVGKLQDCLHDPDTANDCSQVGLDYISDNHTLERMNQSIDLAIMSWL